MYAGAFAATALLVQRLLTSDGRDADHVATASTPVATGGTLPQVVWWIAAYGFFMGIATGATGRFLPLFAEESLGFSTQTAGLIIALAGLLGIGARIVAAHYAEHRVAPIRLLIVLSVVGASLGLVLAATTEATRQLIWLAPPLNAVGTNAWNAVAMLAIIVLVTRSKAGRASGIVMFGFLGGMAVAGPITGWIVDATDSYRVVWIGTVATSLAATAVMIVTEARQRVVDQAEAAVGSEL